MAEIDEMEQGSTSNNLCSERDDLTESVDSSKKADAPLEPNIASTSPDSLADQLADQLASNEDNLKSNGLDELGIKGPCTENSNQNNNEVSFEDGVNSSFVENSRGQDRREEDVNGGMIRMENNKSNDLITKESEKEINAEVICSVIASGDQEKCLEATTAIDGSCSESIEDKDTNGDGRTCGNDNVEDEVVDAVESTSAVFNERISSDGGSVEIAEEADEEETDGPTNTISSDQCAKQDPSDSNIDAANVGDNPQPHSNVDPSSTPVAMTSEDDSRHPHPIMTESVPSDDALHIEQRTTEMNSNVLSSIPDPKLSPAPREATFSSSKTVSKIAESTEDDLLSALEAELEDETDAHSQDADDLDLGDLEDHISTRDDRGKLVKLVEEWQKKYCHAEAKLQSLQVTVQAKSNQDADQHQKKEEEKKEAEAIQRVHLVRISELERDLEQKQKEIAVAKERQIAHDTAAKKAIGKLQTEMVQRIDQVKRLYEESVKEKENMVIRYAKSEKENLDLKKAKEELDKRRRDAGQGLEVISSHNKQLKADRAKLMNDLDAKDVEITALKREMEQMKDDVSSVGIKVKWAQNKLKTELESHKETKVKLTKTEQRLVEAKEETEQIRKNCQEMIRTYQESEEIRSNSLDIQLKEKEQELRMQFQEKEDQMEVHNTRIKELEALKKAHHDTLAELESLQVKSKCLEDGRLHTEGLLTQFKGLLNSQKEENRKLVKQMDELKTLKRKLEESKESVQMLEQNVATRKEDEKELELELDRSREKEVELLQFTEKMTGKNAALHSENLALSAKVDSLTEECRTLTADLEEARSQISQLTADLNQEKQYREREAALLSARLGEKTKILDQLGVQLDDAKDETKTLKRKHAANLKDLTRQLQHAKKKIESLEADGAGPGNGKDAFSSESRTSSTGSLDTLGNSAINGGGLHSASSGSSGGGSVGRQDDSPQSGQDHMVAIAGGNDFPGIDKAMLVDRIVRLQKQLQKRAEKNEFLQEHVNQLVDALQKKSKIIQQYIMRDEAGALSPAMSDVNKAQMSKQSGIMASLYRSQQADPNMTLDLSLEINRKLQAVLEDTLLKNITLKENIDTLGQEIARLSEEAQLSSSRRSHVQRKK